MGGSPRFLALRVEGEAFRNLVEFLSHKLEFERGAVNTFHVAVFLFDNLLHLSFEVFSYDIDNLSETCLNSIINRVIDDGFTIWTEAVHLFESAIAAAHSGSKNKKCWFHFNLFIGFI